MEHGVLLHVEQQELVHGELEELPKHADGHGEAEDTLEVIILLFIYAAEILGEIQSYYTIGIGALLSMSDRALGA